MSKKNITLIGGCGFIGHNMALALHELGHSVTIIDSMMVNNYYSLLQGGKKEYLGFINDRLALLHEADIPVLRMDARDYAMMNVAINPEQPDVIIHLAAIAHIDRANKDPFSTFDHNLRTLENTLDVACNLKKRPHFIYFSSSTVYGNFQEPVLREDAVCNPFGIYGALKYAGEHIVNAYHNIRKLDTTIVRPCAVYGPRCISGRVGQKFIEAALNGKPITVFGDGEVREDFTFVEDLIQGIIGVIDNREKASGETFNITAGEARSLNDLAGIISRTFAVDVTHGPADPEKPHRGTMSIEKAKRLLGYDPQFNLERGMEIYMRWYNDRLPRDIASDV